LSAAEAFMLQGKRVAITGAAGGVGRAVATKMIQAGARLVVTDRPEADLDAVVRSLREHGGEIEGVSADLARQDGVDEVFARVDSALGGLDVLVACAGIGSGPLSEMDDAGWRQVIETNLCSYVACTKAAIERIRVGGGDEGMVIMVGSISVHIKAIGESVYNASKGGVALFAETLRKELIAERIRLTLIEPGAIATSMQPFAPDERAALVEDHQMLPPAEVAEAVMFAATRPPGVDVVTLRIEPLRQKIW